MHAITYAFAALIAWLVLAASCAYGQSLDEINKHVNWEIRYAPDKYGDTWDASCPAFGDCEDYALCKARKFYAAGVPASELKLVVAHDRRSQITHAVLVVYGRVYDNKTNYAFSEKEITYLVPFYACRADAMVATYLPDGSQALPTLFGQKEYWRARVGSLHKCVDAMQKIKE